MSARNACASRGFVLAPLFLVAVALVVAPSMTFSAEVFDEILLKDGSRVIGDIKTMTDGSLEVDTAFGGVIKVQWSEIVSLQTAKPLTFVLGDGSTIVGVAQPGGEGNLDIKSDAIAQAGTVSLESVQAINPPKVKPIKFKGSVNMGGSVSRGNTNTRSLSLLGEFEARSESQRLGLRGSYNYADDDESGVIAQNGRAGIKYDYFITKRLYAFASAFFEHDGVSELNLRTALAAGPGYQLVDKGDFSSNILSEMQLSAEAGIAYFSEDYKRSEDTTTVAARWAVKFDWPIGALFTFLGDDAKPNRVILFHYHEGYPSLENAKDIYISTEQGVRLSLWGGLVATAQVNLRWDSTPAPGFKRGDTIYLMTLGYAFDY